MNENKKTADLAKDCMENFVLTEQDKAELESWNQYLKADMGSRDVETMFGEESEKFDRRKFGKMQCGFCDHQFNPYYVKTLKEGEWSWVWRGDSHKEPEARCEVNCPKCKKELYFRVYVGQ